MNYTDDDLLNFCKNSLCQYIVKIKTWADFKIFLNSITKTKLKTKLKKYFADKQFANDEGIINQQAEKVKNEDAEIRIDNL